MKISRDNNVKHFSKNFLSPILRNLLLAQYLGPLLTPLAPALFSGCYGNEESHESLAAHIAHEQTVLKCTGYISETDGSTLDIFVFEDDRLRRLDSYQKIENYDGKLSGISSTGGEKIFFICADGHRNTYEWADISSYSSLGKIFMELDEETTERPVMTGECRADAGSQDVPIVLKPLSSEVVVESISCDFSGTSYSASRMKNVKAYLTNVSATCPILFTDAFRPNRIINTGQLMESDVKAFREPGIILRYIAQDVGRTVIYPDIMLRCYPNVSAGNSSTYPHTRLVIEGEVEGMTYYWPITVDNADTDEQVGVERGCRYIYNIRIRRKGVTDPDIPFNPGSIELNMTAKPWTEKEDYEISF